MALSQVGSTSKSTEDLEKRLRVLEDRAAIHELKALYGSYCDDGYDADRIAELFTEDAVWESPAVGRFEGREAIRQFFRRASKIFTFAIHYSLNGQIRIEGDFASAKWHLFMPCTVADGNYAMWRASIDHEEYVRANGEWKFRRKAATAVMNTPFEEGWARVRFAK